MLEVSQVIIDIHGGESNHSEAVFLMDAFLQV